MADEALVVLLDGTPIGTVEQDRRGRLSFRYDDAWRLDRLAYPLSLSLPLALAEHPHAPVAAYLSGLLPDNELVLDRWAKQFHVSASNPFALLAHVGEDCAGAVQFVPESRLFALLDRNVPPPVRWLDVDDVAARLRALRLDHSAWRSARDAGQFSLAGAQPKTALLFANGRWAIPSGRTPTTHILKPPTGSFDGHAENEHFCLALARALGLPAAQSQVTHFRDEVAIVIERYDRVHVEPQPRARKSAARASANVRRIHQEDICQALGILPTLKYQNEGGPTPEAIVSLLREHSSAAREDVRTFVDALLFNWLIAGTDAHAKNYSLLHGPASRVRLAPLYDVASALPYPSLDQRRLELAMKLGATYRVRDVAAHNVRELAAALRLDPEEEVARAASQAARMGEQVGPIRDQCTADGLEHALIDRLTVLLEKRAKSCHVAMQVPRRPASRTPRRTGGD